MATSDGDVVALVIPEIGDGPLNIVVDGRQGAFSSVEPGTPASLQDRRFQIGNLEVALDAGTLWEPRPDWDRLRAYSAPILDRLPVVHALAWLQAPKDSLLSLIGQTPAGHGADWQSGPPETDNRLRHALSDAVLEATAWLAAGWKGDYMLLRAGVMRLAGLGGGLTPAGDDFLAGMMLWARLAHSTPSAFCQAVFEAVAPRTTILSAASLRAAADGQCNAAWHRLLAALTAGREDRLAPAVEGVLSYGHTSGADTLAGFLWAGASNTLD